MHETYIYIYVTWNSCNNSANDNILLYQIFKISSKIQGNVRQLGLWLFCNYLKGERHVSTM